MVIARPSDPPRVGRTPLRVPPLAVDPDGEFAGYASLFGVPDLGRDVVRPGAFAASLARRGPAGVRMLWQHDPGEPLGRWISLREDGRGLLVRGRLALAVTRAREAAALIRDGAVDGLSIGFRVVEAERDRASGLRRLLAIDLWEVSIVTFPLLPGARIGPAPSAPGPQPLALAVRRAARRLAVPAASAAPAAQSARTVRTS